MTNDYEGKKNSGMFSLSSGKDVYGELKLDGSNSSLYLQDNEFFTHDSTSEQFINGILLDRTKVTLINNVSAGTGQSHRGDETYYFANSFPHCVLIGEHHINPLDKLITEIHFVIDDASTLFYDFDAFGSLVDASPFIDQIAHANKHNRKITIGESPEILYFTGKREIFSAETVLGRVSAIHCPSHTYGGSNGVCLTNEIFITIDFKEMVTFDEAINSSTIIRKFLETIVGRPQNLLKMVIGTEKRDDRPVVADVIWSDPPKRESSDDDKPHPTDILINAADQPSAFSDMLKKWLERHKDWHDARMRYSGSFSMRVYSIDRIIGAANMFDILPPTAVPEDVELDSEIENARLKCRDVFKGLPKCMERDSVLGALGRMKKSTLKHKIRHRSKYIVDAVGDIFPDLSLVTDEAVNCRNHYVHGSKSKVDYANNSNLVFFFTDTLEFIFAASDLIEAGWDIHEWIKKSRSWSHPFGRYHHSYAQDLKMLKELIG